MSDKLQTSAASDSIGHAAQARPAQTPAHTDSWFDSSPMDHMRSLLNVVWQAQSHRDQAAQDRDRVPALEQENAELRERLETLTHREANARYLATHDGLTGLANRSLLMDRYIQAAAHAQRNQRPIALLVLDLDGFKAINDNHGHLIGDRVLQRIARELESTARAGDTACRYGGDEFVLLLASVDSLADARVVAEKVRVRMLDALRAEDIALDVTASCGIAMYPEDGDNWHALMEAADIAMYQDKPRASNGSADGAPTIPRRPMRSHARYGDEDARIAMAIGRANAANGGPAQDRARAK